MKYIVYKTTNLVNNKAYIGIHQTNNVDDGYLGSGLALLKAVDKYGKSNFTKEIIEYCDSYEELIEKEKFYVNKEWVKCKLNYNLKTGGQSSGILSDESKEKISKTLKAKYKSGEIIPNYIAPYIATDTQKKQISNTLKERYKNEEHHLKNSTPWNKGLIGVQVAWNKGKKLGTMSDLEKEKRSLTMKKYWEDNVHPSIGKTSWNSGKSGLPPSWNKGMEMEKIECPHCNKMVDKGNGKRWHFDNCKYNKI